MTTKHTPTPWAVDHQGRSDERYAFVYSENEAVKLGQPQAVIVDCYNSDYLLSNEERDANAAFIVRACNEYDGLIEENRKLKDQLAGARGVHKVVQKVNDYLLEALVTATKRIDMFCKKDQQEIIKAIAKAKGEAKGEA